MKPANTIPQATSPASAARLAVPGSRLAILGAGRSGIAAARLAALLGARSVVLADAGASELPNHPAITPRFNLGPAGSLTTQELDDLDAVILSPGIDPALPLVATAAERGLPILAELEFAWQQTDRPVIAITGTNGKTTTTELVVRLLQNAGVHCRPAGNHGMPLSELLLDELQGGARDDAHVLEISSFQLEAIHSFQPRVGVWLNFAPDHLDRYPDIASYRAAKMRLFDFMQATDTAVLNALQPVDSGRARQVAFSLNPGLTPGRWTWQSPHVCCEGKSVIDLMKTRLRGHHNADNLLAACAAAEAFLGPDASRSFAEAAADYQPPAHRYEWVAGIEGRAFINDSKATNLHALEAALMADDDPVVLIAGGKDKQLDYSTLTNLVTKRCRAVIAIGEITPQLLDTWGDSLPCHPSEDMQAAVRLAFFLSQPGDTILLAPGTSSFDMFSGYAARGDAFRSSVQQIQSNT